MWVHTPAAGVTVTLVTPPPECWALGRVCTRCQVTPASVAVTVTTVLPARALYRPELAPTVTWTERAWPWRMCMKVTIVLPSAGVATRQQPLPPLQSRLLRLPRNRQQLRPGQRLRLLKASPPLQVKVRPPVPLKVIPPLPPKRRLLPQLCRPANRTLPDSGSHYVSLIGRGADVSAPLRYLRLSTHGGRITPHE